MRSLSREQQISVLHMLVEGNSLRSITRLTSIHRTPIARLMVRVGDALHAFLDERMRNLILAHVQADEIWTFVRKKQHRLKPEERDNDEIGDQFLFIALDQKTKLVPSYVIGKRTRENTEAFMNDLAGRMRTMPRPGELSGDKPVISTDGFAAYPNAVDFAFGNSVRHGVLIKDYQESVQPGRYAPPEVVGETRIPRSDELDASTICTSHVERHNLTIRTFMRRFTRLALGFSKKLSNLSAATAIYVAHYNFCRWHGTLKKTPAMAAELTGHPWTLEELLNEAGV